MRTHCLKLTLELTVLTLKTKELLGFVTGLLVEHRGRYRRRRIDKWVCLRLDSWSNEQRFRCQRMLLTPAVQSQWLQFLKSFKRLSLVIQHILQRLHAALPLPHLLLHKISSLSYDIHIRFLDFSINATNHLLQIFHMKFKCSLLNSDLVLWEVSRSF